jgi:hypothetical protein
VLSSATAPLTAHRNARAIAATTARQDIDENAFQNLKELRVL